MMSLQKSTFTLSDLSDTILSTIERSAMYNGHEHSFFSLQSIGFALSKARNLLTAELDVALAGADIKSSQIGALTLLSRGSANSPFALSKLLGVDSGAVTRMLDGMERKRLVRRDRSDLDRRLVNLTLTESGWSAQP